jgi:pyruvate,water dikinase
MGHSERCLRELARLDSAECAGMRTILFVCTGNAIRSQIAEALVNHYFGDRWAAFSGGTMPMGVHKDTIEVMREIGIDLSGQFAKDVELFKDCAFDQVVILCSDAGSNCPVFFHSGKTDQMSFDDPLSPNVMADAIVFSYKSELRSLRKEMQKDICAYIGKLDSPGAAESSRELAHAGGGQHAQGRAALLQRIFRVFSWGRKDRIVMPADGRIAAKYRAFKTLLGHNHAALERIAQLEQVYFGGKVFSLADVRMIYAKLLESVYGIVHALAAVAGEDRPVLIATLKRIDDALTEQFNSQPGALATKHLVLDFAEVLPEMKDLVGSKAANLALIGNALNLPVPEGFAITAHACEHFLEQNGLTAIIADELSRVVPDALAENESRSLKLRTLIRAGTVPQDLANEVTAAYERVARKLGPGVRVAMRSSAVGEDTEPTFAGQYETVLNVTRQGLFDAYKEVLASKYSPQAICYRMQYGLDDRETPMCVAAVAMVDARASGVVYSRDPSQAGAALLKVNSLWGLGEQLVDGSASPDVFLVDRDNLEIRERVIANKQWRLTSLQEGGIAFDEIPVGEQATASLDDESVRTLANHCLVLEEFFGGPQDIEWACDKSGAIFILQSRPLFLPEVGSEEKTRREYPGHPVVLEQGVMASPGVATGTVRVALTDDDLKSLPEDAILVVKTASPKYARVAGTIRGLIADAGSATSHMASVAREFGLPAIVDARDATRRLKSGETITLAASSVTVYRGVVEDLLQAIRPSRKVILDSPVHRRMRTILDLITPLNLIETNSPSFSPEGCKTFHDIIRYAHEQAVREMFGMSEDSAETRVAIKLVSRLPLSLYLIDLGGGLRQGINTRGGVTADKLECRPLVALWRGFTHPGVIWEGTMNTGTGKLSSVLAAPAMAELGEQPGGDSYAIVSGDYLNFSAKFAYHFATIDALCGESSSQNYISLQFSGGAGSYYGRSLRVQLMANILERLDFEITTTGDLLKAVFARHDASETAERLDLLGRLLASSKLLDMTLSSQQEIELYCEEFFKGNYGFLSRDNGAELSSMYVQGGHWTRVVENGHVYCVQDGSNYGGKLGARIAGTFAKAIGMKDSEFLDNIAAYYYFPLAILKDSELSEGAASARIRPLAGKIDRAGGIAFGIRDWDNYFVLRINALEGNIILFEFRNGKRHKLALVERSIDADIWHDLRVEIHGTRMEGFFNGDPVISLDTGRSLAGFVGLWTKADSTTWFDALVVEKDGSLE